MKYETYAPHPELEAFVKFYWTLEVPFDPQNKKQKIIPDGCIEMTFNFEDGIKRYISEEDFVVHPRAMVMGQRTKSYFIEPLGNVNSFAVCFYPYGFTNFVNTPLKDLVDAELPISQLFDEKEAKDLEEGMINADSTDDRIQIINTFLLSKLRNQSTIENIVQSTVDALIATGGSTSIGEMPQDESSKRRQLERKFKDQIGLSPKQLGKVIRLQAALNLMLNKSEKFTGIAYESEYFDQSHFIKDFKEFTGITPKEFIGSENMSLAKLFYK